MANVPRMKFTISYWKEHSIGCLVAVDNASEHKKGEKVLLVTLFSASL